MTESSTREDARTGSHHTFLRLLTPAISVVALGASSLVEACSPPPQPNRPPTAPAPSASSNQRLGTPPELGPLIAVGWGDDRVRGTDGPLAPDGVPDFVFRVRVSGPIDNLILCPVDGAGVPLGLPPWDTFVGAMLLPTSLGALPLRGVHSPTLGVYDHNGQALNPKGVLEHGSFDRSLLELRAADVHREFFLRGHAFTLFVLRPDGAIDRSTTTLLE